MSYEFRPLLVPFVFAIACVFLPWYYRGQLSDKRFGAALVLWTAPIAVWSVAAMMRVSATTVAAERLWHNVRFVGPAFGAIGYFLFAAVYTNHESWFQRRRLAVLFVVPVLTNVLVWTNGGPLVGTSVESTGAGPYAMTFTPGPWFVVHALYSYGLILIGTAWVVRRFWEYRDHIYFRKQTLSVLLLVVVAMSTNAAFNLDVTTVDWTPVAGALSAIIFTVAASEFRLLDLSPLARETVVENMDSGMLVTNTDGQIIDANSTASTILEVEKDDLIGNALGDVFITSTGTIEELMAAPGDTKTVQVGTDDVRHYDITVSPVSMSSNSHLGSVITFSDVTTRVERQQRLHEQKQSLERQNERLERFTGVVSHDLRNPMNVANMHLELAQQDVDNEHLADASNALDRMETLIEDLLTLAREGRQVDEMEPVDLAETGNRCWQVVETGEVTLRTETDQTIMADPSRVQQLLGNLFRNSVEHGSASRRREASVAETPDGAAEDGGDTVTVTIGALENGFYVADDGPGIPEDRRDQVLDAGYSTAENGTGLGLNIVREIVEAHGWEIAVTDSETGGARFEITGVSVVSTAD